MHTELAQKVYDTLCGQALAEFCVNGVENAFAPGSDCDRSYEAAVAARDRLLLRLGVEEDRDLCCIFDQLSHIARQLGLRMFACGSGLASCSAGRKER